MPCFNFQPQTIYVRPGLGLTSSNFQILFYVLQYKVFDTGSLEANTSMSLGTYYQDADLILFVYDVTSINTLQYIEEEFNLICEKRLCPAASFILVRNKVDISKSRIGVKFGEEDEFLDNHVSLKESLCDRVETSAAKDSGICELFSRVVPKALDGVVAAANANKQDSPTSSRRSSSDDEVLLTKAGDFQRNAGSIRQGKCAIS